MEKLATGLDTKIDQQHFEIIMEEATNLKKLVIENGSALPANIIERNKKRLKKLEVFELYQFTQQTEEAKTILGKYPGLKSYITPDKY